MLAVYLCPREGHTQRLVLGQPTITIGSAEDCVIRLADLAPRHCELVVLAAGITIEDPDGAGTRVGGRVIGPATSVYEDETVYIGTYSFRFERLEHAPDADEDALLAAISAGDAVSREVYADWLEENGDLRRAEFVRLQELVHASSGAGPADAHGQAFAEHGERLRELARLTDIAWRARIARSAITCTLVQRNLGAEPCDARWELLAETDDPEVRTCELCRAEFQYCLGKADVAPRRIAVLDYAAMAVPSDIADGWHVDEVTPVRFGVPPPHANPPAPALRWVRGQSSDGSDPDVDG